MKFKKEYIILAAVILLLSLYLVQRETDRALYQLPELPGMKASELTKIEINRPNETMVLKKKDDVWYIGEQAFPANKTHADDIAQVIAELKLTALVSESKDYRRYDLDPDKRILVKAWAGEKMIREFEAGKNLSSSSHTFVKISGDDRVYHASGNFKAKLERSIGDMRDKTVLSFSAADIQEIHFTRGKESASFYRKTAPIKKEEGDNAGKTPIQGEMVWKNAKNQMGNQSKLNNMISSLSSLMCEGYMDEGAKEGLTDPVYTIRLKGTREYSLAIFEESKEHNKDHPAVSSENKYPFWLKQWRVKDLMPDFKILVKEVKK